MLAICIKNYFVEKGEALVVFFSVYGFLWSFVIQYKLEKSLCSLLSRVFNDEINDLWSAKYSFVITNISVSKGCIELCNGKLLH